MNWTKIGFALIAFVVGCGVGGFASQHAIPSARAGTRPTRWEYFFIGDPETNEMNKAGAEGWELTSQSPYGCWLKRPLP
jgi:hypothetical protein